MAEVGEWVKLPVTPMGAPRQTQRDRWKKRLVVERYHAFRDELRIHAHNAGYDVGVAYAIVFELPMPKSWSQKKRKEHDGRPHQQKPDIDNLVKAFQDTLAAEDKAIYRVDAKKRWTSEREGCILVCNLEAAE